MIVRRLLSAYDAESPYQRALVSFLRGISGASADACSLCRAMACIGFNNAYCSRLIDFCSSIKGINC